MLLYPCSIQYLQFAYPRPTMWCALLLLKYHSVVHLRYSCVPDVPIRKEWKLARLARWVPHHPPLLHWVVIANTISHPNQESHWWSCTLHRHRHCHHRRKVEGMAPILSREVPQCDCSIETVHSKHPRRTNSHRRSKRQKETTKTKYPAPKVLVLTMLLFLSWYWWLRVCLRKIAVFSEGHHRRFLQQLLRLPIPRSKIHDTARKTKVRALPSYYLEERNDGQWWWPFSCWVCFFSSHGNCRPKTKLGNRKTICWSALG
mmetsp:Transcript_39236/g.81425  ORF Transcript_39236/g.81425 Transcript_39236/m.81425 type:complete len:259 (+) Transcript_39236:1109-1885(+)